MESKGLIFIGARIGTKDQFVLANPSITWEGHDFLDTVRDSEVWRKTKEGATAAGGFTFDIVKELAKGLIKTQIKKHTGLELDLG